MTQELVKLLSSPAESVRQRASEALRDMAAGEKPGGQKGGRVVNTAKGGGAQHTGGLINLLKDGLKDGNVEAQEYALWSLSSITDAVSREAMVATGGIPALIASLVGMAGDVALLSDVAQEHAARVLSGLTPIGDNARAVKEVGGIGPLVLLLTVGNADAKEHAAHSLAQLARRAGAANEIAEAGGVSAFVGWLADPTLGPPEIAARALSEIALENPDTQTQIAEEGAIELLVGMMSSWSVKYGATSTTTITTNRDGQMTSRITMSAGPSAPENKSATLALRLAIDAAWALATLVKDHPVNQITVAEENGIPPLLDLLMDARTSAQESATKAVWHLGQLEENQSSIPRAGASAGCPTLTNPDEP